jgi:hypothetical protein
MNYERNDTTNTSLLVNNKLSSIIIPPQSIVKKSQTVFYKESLTKDQVIEPLDKQREQVIAMEKELFGCINLEWGVDIITEDVPILQNEKYYYIHLV